jgi:hypothetical protein
VRSCERLRTRPTVKQGRGGLLKGYCTQYIRWAGHPDSSCAATILRKLKGSNFQCGLPLRPPDISATNPV